MFQLQLLLLVGVGTIFLTKQCYSFEQDQINGLPGVDFEIPFQHYSGYLDAGNGRQIFYWLVLKEHGWDKAPLLLWLNGGPGCSSLGAMFTENGPLRVKSDNKTVELDPYGWNQLGNVLYMETPINVGFSYNQSQIDISDMYNDKASTDAHYNALVDFFTNKFPQFQSLDFYLTGESYAGIYLPLLTKKILQNQQQHNFNLKGLAIGNGLLDEYILSSSRIEYAYYHGLISFENWKQFKQICCQLPDKVSKCDFPMLLPNQTLIPQNGNDKCAKLTANWYKKIGTFDGFYNIYNDCDRNPVVATHLCPNRNYGQYLNQAEVKQALHVDFSLFEREWLECNEQVRSQYQTEYFSMDQIFKEIIYDYKFNNIVLYNGDIDMACDFLFEQRFLYEKMQFKLLEESSQWNYDNRMAGIATHFENGVRFFTIHGAGHMTPMQKPGQSIAIIKDLLGIESIN